MKIFSTSLSDLFKGIILILCIIIVLYYSGSVYSVLNKYSFLTYGLYILTGFIFIISLFFKKIIISKSEKKIFFLTFYFILMYLFTMIINNDVQFYKLYSNYIIFVIFSFSIVRLISFQQFAKYFVSVLLILSLISLLNYVVYNYTELFKSIQLVTSENNVIYAKTLLGYIYYGNPIRNIGYFWEPGVYSSILGLALLFNILILKNNFYVNIFFTISIITTNSAGGLIVLSLVLLLLLVKIIKKNDIKLLSLFTLLSICLVFLLIGNADFNLNSINKILHFSLDDARITSILYNFEIFKANFLFGVGYGNLSELFLSGIQNGIVVAQTSTIMMYLAASGILGIGYIMIWIYGIMNFNLFSRIERFFIVVLMIFILNKEPHISIMLTNIVMFYYVKNSVEKKGENHTNEKTFTYIEG